MFAFILHESRKKDNPCEVVARGREKQLEVRKTLFHL